MRPVLCLLTAACLAAPLGARAEGVKVAVVPFAPLTGDVPVRAGGKSATLLAGELKNLSAITPVELSVEPNEAAAKALQAARDAVTEGQGLEKRRKFGAAAAAYRRAIGHYDAAAPLIADVNELSDAHVALGTVLYLTGDDANGAKELSHAVALTPSRPFAGEATSKLFAATVKKLRERVLAEPKATLRVESTPARAMVVFDGQEVGRTPLTLKEIPPGKHLWRVLLPTSEPAGGTVLLASGQKNKVAAGLTGSSPVSRLNAALVANKLDDNVLALAKQAAAAAGAELVAFGGLVANGQDLVLESFLYSASKGAVVRLPQKSFDGELISAGMELFKIAGEVGGRTEQLGAAEKLPAKVSAEAPPPEAAEQTEVAYALPGEKQEVVEETKSGPRRPVDPTKQNRVLRPREK